MHDDLAACRDGSTYYYADLPEEFGSEGVWPFEERFEEVAKHVDLLPGDDVIDVGCAEGLITMAAAERVRSARGVEIQPQRIEAAKTIAEQRGLSNVTFEVASACDLRLEPESYDVVLFLGIFHHLPAERRLATLEHLLHATRRQILIKTPIVRGGHQGRLNNIAEACRKVGFAGQLFANPRGRGGDLVVARRIAASAAA